MSTSNWLLQQHDGKFCKILKFFPLDNFLMSIVLNSFCFNNIVLGVGLLELRVKRNFTFSFLDTSSHSFAVGADILNSDVSQYINSSQSFGTIAISIYISIISSCFFFGIVQSLAPRGFNLHYFKIEGAPSIFHTVQFSE